MSDVYTMPVHWTITWTIRIGGAILIGLFLLMPRLRRNRFSGIRYCYTLADDDVWRKVHGRFRWFFLMLGLMAWYPLRNGAQLMAFTTILCGLLIVFVVWSYFYAKRLYVEKHGTTKTVCRGFFMYEPPGEADKPAEGSDVQDS